MVLAQELNDIETQLDALISAEWATKRFREQLDQVDAALPVLGRVLEKLNVLDADLLAASKHSGAALINGHRAQHSYLVARTRCSETEARRRCRVSKVLRSMNHARTALLNGTISFGHFDLMAQASRPVRRRSYFIRDEAQLIKVASKLGVAEFKEHLRRWADRVDPDGGDARDRARQDDAQIHASETFEGMVRIDGWLDPIGGHTFTTELERLEQILFAQDWAAAEAEHGEGNVNATLIPDPGNRRARALVMMASRSAVLDPEHPGVQPTVMLNVLMDHTTYLRELEAVALGTKAVPNPNRICELENGTQISPRTALLLAATGKARRIVVEADGAILNFGKGKRIFDGLLKEAILLRDRRCSHPGCNIPARNCQIDHIDSWRTRPDTSIGNADAKCGWHNRWKETPAGQNWHRENPRPDKSGNNRLMV